MIVSKREKFVRYLVINLSNTLLQVSLRLNCQSHSSQFSSKWQRCLMIWIMSIAFPHKKRLLQWPLCWHSALNSSLPILYPDTRLLFQEECFHHGTSLLKPPMIFSPTGSRSDFLAWCSRLPECVQTCFSYFWLFSYSTFLFYVL